MAQRRAAVEEDCQLRLWYPWAGEQLQSVGIDGCNHSRQHSWAGAQPARQVEPVGEQAARYESLPLSSGLPCRLQADTARLLCLGNRRLDETDCWY